MVPAWSGSGESPLPGILMSIPIGYRQVTSSLAHSGRGTNPIHEGFVF